MCFFINKVYFSWFTLVFVHLASIIIYMASNDCSKELMVWLSLWDYSSCFCRSASSPLGLGASSLSSPKGNAPDDWCMR